MAHITGVGGVFFRSKDPKALKDWYVEHLGAPVDEHGFVVFKWEDGSDAERPGSTVWSPFEQDTTYFKSDVGFMINFRVDDLDGLLAQLRAAGVQVDENVDTVEEIGRFGWLTDPEGNRIELWEPAAGC